METLDTAIAALQHPFFMMVGGMIFFFTLKWSFMSNEKKNGSRFWTDQKDELIVSVVGGLMFIVWDDEMLAAYDWFMVSIFNQADHEPVKLQPFFYLLVAPFIERIYTWYPMIGKKFNRKQK